MDSLRHRGSYIATIAFPTAVVLGHREHIAATPIDSSNFLLLLSEIDWTQKDDKFESC